MNSDLLLDYFSRISDAPDAAIKLRRFVLEGAIRGKLVSEVPDTEPAHELISHIQCEKNELLKSGLLKRVEKCEILANESLSFRLPPHWIVTTLRTLCLSITDGDHIPPPKSDDGIPFLVIGDVRDQTIRFENCRHVPEEYYSALDPVRRPLRGDILYTLVGSYGIPVLVRTDVPFCVQRHIAILRPSQFINWTYLGYVLESRLVLDQASSLATGIAQKTVPLAGLRSIKVPLPPLAEQNRIVLKLEDLMAVCSRLQSAQNERESRRDQFTASVHHHLNNGADPEATRSHAQFFINHLPCLTARPDQIKHLRQTVMSLGIRGKLVQQDAKDEPACQLIARIDSERSRLLRMGELTKSKKTIAQERSVQLIKLPSTWIAATLGEIAFDFRYGTSVKCGYERTGEPVLRIPNVDNGHINTADLKFGPLSSREAEELRLRLGDILMVRSNGSLDLVGRPAMVESETVGYCYAGYLVRVRTSTELLNTKYLVFALNSRFVRDQIEVPIRTTVGLKNVNTTELSSLVLPIPPRGEQDRIVKRASELISLCDELEQGLTEAESEANHLLDSVLYNALDSASIEELAEAL